MSKLRDCWEWAEFHRPPLAFVSVGVKAVRMCALLPLLCYLMPATAGWFAWTTLYVYGLCQMVAWVLDSVLDADGSGS